MPIFYKQFQNNLYFSFTYYFNVHSICINETAVYLQKSTCYLQSTYRKVRPRSHGTGSVWSPYQFEKSQDEHDSQICDNITELD